jgi:hypothetical protein
MLQRPQRAVTRFPWLVLATCAPWLLIVIGHHVRSPDTFGLAALVGAVTLAAHVPTTAAFYADRALWPFLRRNPLRFFVLPVAAMVIGAAFAWWAPSDLLPVGLTLYLAWQLHHFTRQNLGMLVFLFRSTARPGPSADERRLINITGVAGILGFAPLYEGIPGVGEGAQRAVWWAGMGVLALAFVWLARIWPRDPVRGLALSAATLFYAPLFLYPHNIFVATVAYSAAHGAQYFMMAGHLGAGRSRIVAVRWILFVALLAVVGGRLLKEASELGGGDLRWLYGLGLGFTAAHFIVDAGLWKLRDPDQRAWMRERFTFL